MLKSPPRPSASPADPQIKAKILVSILVAGKPRAVGEVVTMARSDAYAMVNIGRVELLD